MKNGLIALICALTSVCGAGRVSGRPVHEMPVLHAVDALGRETPLSGHGAPALRTDKERLVGLFYFLNLGKHGRARARDVTKILAANPKAPFLPDDPAWGVIGFSHHWGEPYYGYYFSDDEWVVRHHLKLLMQAGVDFLFFDVTNGFIHERNAKLLMGILQDYHDQGWKIPKVTFYANPVHHQQTVQKLYETYYRPRFAPDTWLVLNGKPVVVANRDHCTPETREFFTIVKSQWPNRPGKPGGWPWMDWHRPQELYPGDEVARSVMSVSVAQHPQSCFGDSAMYGETGNWGRAFHDGANDPAPDAWMRGPNFAEQFEHAIKVDPDIVMVTGWNEWMAGRWKGTKERPIRFYDCANGEYSRDLEMMRGGYFDNYYMQLVDCVRRYKGVAEVPETPESDSAEIVASTYPCFWDGGFARDAPGSGTNYVNRTQRNVPVQIKVRHTAAELAFDIATLDPIRIDGGEPLSVYLNLDGRAGYQFAIRRGADGRVRLVRSKRRDETLDFASDGVELPAELDGRRFTVRVPRTALGLAEGKPFTVFFKVADATEPYRQIADFYDLGCAAPLGRLNFIYRAR